MFRIRIPDVLPAGHMLPITAPKASSLCEAKRCQLLFQVHAPKHLAL